MNIIKPIHSDYQSFPRFQSMVNQLKETIQINGIPKKQEDTEYLMKLIDSFMPNYTENGYNPDTGRFVQISFYIKNPPIFPLLKKEIGEYISNMGR